MPTYKGADAYEGTRAGDLTSYERDDRKEPHWRVTSGEAKLLLIASTGFFIDAYDLFAINLVIPMLNYQYNGTLSSDIMNIPLQGGVLKAAANLGCVVGQVLFGLLADVYGRKAIYGKELMIIMLGVVLTIAVPNSLSSTSIFTWITVFRVVMGVGIGGDYPMSASVVSDRSNLSRRGLMLSFIFAMQGWGNLGASLVCLVVLSIFKTSIQKEGHYGHLDAVWRLVVGLVLIPCLGTVYQRLTLPESARFKNVQKLRERPELVKSGGREEGEEEENSNGNGNGERMKGTKMGEAEEGGVDKPENPKAVLAAKSHAFGEFIVYFSEWRHLRTLIGTTMSWFLLDIAFYGINLNQSIVIQAIGYNKATEPWQFLFDNTKANLIITAAGYLPGYYLTMISIEHLGRKNIQFFGFLLEALFLGIVAGDFESLSKKPAAFIVCFSLLQFFFNFGANSTTFIIPAEVFPTRVRGFAHGTSAACGKIGAVLASLGFASWAHDIGTDKVLWIFFAISILGALVTLLIPETTNRDADVIDMQERRETVWNSATSQSASKTAAGRNSSSDIDSDKVAA